MNYNFKNKLLDIVIIILLSFIVSLLVFNYKAKDIIVTQTQTVTINADKKDKIDINKCTKEDLKQLPGVGDKLADTIINNRPFKSINDLLKIDGIGDKILKNIEGRIKV